MGEVISDPCRINVQVIVARAHVCNWLIEYHDCFACCSANPEHDSTLFDNTLEISIPLVHEVDTTITG